MRRWRWRERFFSRKAHLQKKKLQSSAFAIAIAKNLYSIAKDLEDSAYLHVCEG